MSCHDIIQNIFICFVIVHCLHYFSLGKKKRCNLCLFDDLLILCFVVKHCLERFLEHSINVKKKKKYAILCIESAKQVSVIFDFPQ